jgi:hypothetical protein
MEEFGYQWGTSLSVWQQRWQQGLLQVIKQSNHSHHKKKPKVVAAEVEFNDMENRGPLLENGDVIKHLVHFHECPAFVPKEIKVKKFNGFMKHMRKLTTRLVEEGETNEDNHLQADTDDDDDDVLYVINKPSSIPCYPVHMCFEYM